MTFSPVGPVTLGLGINLSAGQSPLILTLREHGEIVRREWFGITDIAGRLFGVIEGSADLDKVCPNVRK